MGAAGGGGPRATGGRAAGGAVCRLWGGSPGAGIPALTPWCLATAVRSTVNNESQACTVLKTYTQTAVAATRAAGLLGIQPKTMAVSRDPSSSPPLFLPALPAGGGPRLAACAYPGGGSSAGRSGPSAWCSTHLARPRLISVVATCRGCASGPRGFRGPRGPAGVQGGRRLAAGGGGAPPLTGPT